MATQTIASRHHARTDWGGLILQADGVCCVACGLVLALDSASLATFTGLSRSLLLALAPPLILYGAGLFVAARAARRVPRLLTAIPMVNAAWIVATTALLLLDWSVLTPGGRWVVILQALLAADFAIAQLVARRRAT